MLPVKPRAMRVLLTADAVGGVWRYAVDVGSELSARGMEVHLAGLGPRPAVAQEREARQAGLTLTWIDEPLDWQVESLDQLRAGAQALDELSREWSPDLLHLNSPALAPLLESRKPRLVAAHSCVTTWWSAVRGDLLPEAWAWHRQAVGEGLATADVAVAPTRAFADALRRGYGALPRLRTVHNGTRISAPPERKEHIALAAGRWWDDGKNLATLDAAAMLSTCPVFAAGPMEGPDGAVVSGRGVRALGSLPKTEMADWLARAAIFVSTARYEPFGLAPLEAAAAGAALVLSDIPTFRELWDGCAVFAPPDDPSAFAAALDRLLVDDAERERLARAGRRQAGRYSLARQGDELASAYSAACSHCLQKV